MATDNQASQKITLTLSYQGKTHTLEFFHNETISDLSIDVTTTFKIPPENQKFMIPKLGLQKPPFKDPELLIATFVDKKIMLMGSTAEQAGALAKESEEALRVAVRRNKPLQKVSAYKTHDWKKEQEESQYTFTTLRPLPYLPRPERSLQFLQRLKDDVGIKAAMRMHKFTVPLLTEMNPVEHTQSNHEGTTRTLGLNRNKGEVIELRLRTDAYDGYRDYKTIRNTLCHELAHNVHGPHDRNFWELCKQIEKEVDKADYKSGGHTISNEEFYAGGGDADEEVHDHGAWTGGEFVLGASPAGGAVSTGQSSSSAAGMSRREVLAKAAEERMKRMREQQQNGDAGGQSGA